MDINTRELQRAIGKLKGLINTKSPYNAIKGILYADGVMCATDMNVHARVKVDTGLIPTNERFIIPIIAFDAINKLSASTTTLTLNRDTLNVSSGKFNADFVTPNADDFPTPDASGEAAMSVEVDFAQFINALDSVAFAVSADEKKGVLCGVNMASGGAIMRMTGLDGFRAATARLNLADIHTFSVTVPQGFWTVLAKISSGEKKVTFSVGENNKSVSIKGEEFEVVTRTLEGNFADVQSIMDGIKPDKQIIVSKDDILHALDLHGAALKDSGVNNLVVLYADPDTASLVFSAKSASSNFSYEISAELIGLSEPFKIGFNSRYLMDAIKAMPDTDEVRLYCKSAVTGALVQDMKDLNRYCALVLPVRFNNV